MKHLWWAVLFVWMSLGCAARAEITVLPEGSARLEVEMGLEPAFLAYWSDLKELDSQLGPTPFDAASVSAGLGRYPEFLGASVNVEGKDKLRATARITSLNSLGRRLAGSGGRSLIETGPRFAQLYLDQAGFSRILQISDVAGSEALGSLFPPEGQSMSQGEFEELVKFSLEPYTDTSLELARRASFTVVMVLPSRVESAPGAKVQGNRAVWEIPMSRLFRLREPLVLRATW